MKKLYTFLLVIVSFVHLQAQREYLPTKADLDHFYTTKTYVVLEENPLSDFNMEIRDAVEKFWDITEFEFIKMKDFSQKSADKNASFLYLAAVSFEKDRSNTRYKFLCLSLGGDYVSIDEMKDVANIPLSYYGVDSDHFSYKLGPLVRFLQNHVKLITEDQSIISQNIYKYYNENMGDLKAKTLYLVEDELGRDVASVSKIRAIYPYEVKIVDRETIRELIMAKDENAVVLYKVGPEGKKLNARVYKILVGVSDAKFYYFEYHKVTEKKPDAFLASDFKKLAKATK
ncbi:MAG: hypothetical protein KAR16_04220 [Bacteroidales bacterium]|nr:hypothetical protein [Bacteroidales bacterium]